MKPLDGIAKVLRRSHGLGYDQSYSVARSVLEAVKPDKAQGLWGAIAKILIHKYIDAILDDGEGE